MQYINCGRGHYYNPEQTSTCPYCSGESNSRFINLRDDITMDRDPKQTEPIYNIPGKFDSVEDVGQTIPLDQQSDAILPEYETRGTLNPLETRYFQDAPANGVQNYPPTQPVNRVSDSEAPCDNMLFPVVGWLVCVEGPSKGRDYRIHSQYNNIGRARHMDICIEGDNAISAERAARLAYDDTTRTFFFAPDQGRNILRVNGKLIMAPVELHTYDVLTIGNSKLVFVPFCSERFEWNDQ